MDTEASQSRTNREELSLVFWQNNPEDTAFSCKYTRKMSTKYREFIGKKQKENKKAVF